MTSDENRCMIQDRKNAIVGMCCFIRYVYSCISRDLLEEELAEARITRLRGTHNGHASEGCDPFFLKSLSRINIGTARP